MKLNRKLWTAALAVAMTTPSAMAAQDTAGMHYTSAAEGFYASIRLRYVSNGGEKDGAANIENSSSRIGVRGTNDLGAGLEGFYQYEMLVNTDQGEGVGTRLGLVGLRGDFGSVVAGAFWPDTYNWVYGATDVANRHSGNMTGGFGQYRTSKSLQYTTPDLNGFQAAVLIKADSSSDGEGARGSTGKVVIAVTERVVTPSATTVVNIRTSELDATSQTGRLPDGGYYTLGYPEFPRVVGGGVTAMVTPILRVESKDSSVNPKDDNDIDHWSIAAKYDIAGFSTGLSFSRYADAIGRGRFNADTGEREPDGRVDRDSWAFKLGYSQDNWYVNGWYGQISDADGRVCDTRTVNAGTAEEAEVAVKCGDTEVFSLAGGISVDKVKVYAVYETMEKGQQNNRADDTRSTLGAQYTLGSNSWTWVEYAGRDFDSSDSEDSDFSIGLGHSF